MNAPRLGWLFAYDWNRAALARLEREGVAQFDQAGFDLHHFPSNARLLRFDLERFAEQQARRAQARSWRGVFSHHEQFGALAAALVAERLKLPAPPVSALLAAQHKLHARSVLDRVAPEASLPAQLLPVELGHDIPPGLAYPSFVKPIKAAFSVLAREVPDRDSLQAHTRFSWAERWVIRRLVAPFDRLRAQRLPESSPAHRLMIEACVPLGTPQFNLDGWVQHGQVHAVGVVDAIMVPGTAAFMRWEVPSRLPAAVQARALDIARRFLGAIGFDHGFFNLEFFWDAAAERITVIECNPRMASQFADLHERTQGLHIHAMAVAIALGEDPLAVPRAAPTAGAAASLVYRSFAGQAPPPQPSAAQRAAFAAQFPDGLVFGFAKTGASLARELKWTGSHRYGIVHLGGRDAHALRERGEQASRLLGWPAPWRDEIGAGTASRSAPLLD
jgi:hypothetical protein